ncbi:MAG: MCE family protein [Desulfobacterales bacterium]|nr:MCE family protein [Desulfobacterales bacterium]
MASIKTKLTVGVFVLTGFAIAFIAIIWLGMSTQFEKGRYFSAYFDESVQGLSKDSPVKYRGVSIGRVASIQVAPDATLIEVVLKVETDLKPDEAMVAQLKSVGITGIMFMELDRKEVGEPDMSPKLTFKPEYPVVYTKPSEISRIIDSFNEALNQIKAMDLGGISDRVKALLSRVDTSVADLELGRLSMEISDALARWNTAVGAVEAAGTDLSQLTRHAGKAVGQIKTTFVHVDGLVADSRDDVTLALAEIRQTVQAAKAVLGQSAALVSQGNHLLKQEGSRLMDVQDHLAMTLENLALASHNLNQLMEELSAQPSRLLFAAPPPPPRLQENPVRE